jgi:hypothetical protein
MASAKVVAALAAEARWSVTANVSSQSAIAVSLNAAEMK